MSKGEVNLSIDKGIASVVFNRPDARNAMTWSMYAELMAICKTLQDNCTVRVATFRGAGGRAFVAGTDIEQFREFKTGHDGVQYEKTVEECVRRLETLPFPTLAIIDGYAVGGGLALAAACDFRIATSDASFGVPIARTLGNCLSTANTARILTSFGVSRATRMLMLAEMIKAEEAHLCGFVHEIVAFDQLDITAENICNRLASNAPLTMKIAKETFRRIATENLPSNEDLIHECYDSQDFKIGIEAFLEKKIPIWTGR